MQQRPWSSYSYRVPEEHVITIGNVAPQQPQVKLYTTPRASTDGLPLYDPRSAIGKKEASLRSKSAEKWVHVVPVIVLFCLFVLWWFSVSVKVVSLGGRVTATHEIEIPLLLNKTRIDIAILAATAMSPFASAPQNLTVNNVTQVPSVKVVSIDGRLTAKSEIEILLPLNETRIDVRILAATAMSPFASVPHNLTVSNVTEVPSGESRND